MKKIFLFSLLSIFLGSNVNAANCPTAGSWNQLALNPPTNYQDKVIGYGASDRGCDGNTAVFLTDTQIRTAAGLGTAATQNSTAFATAAQGTNADTAVQPATLSAVLNSYATTSSLATIATSGSYADLSNKPVSATTSVAGFMSSTDKTKLDGIATGATANSSDATLLNRTNHTGTQTASTISDFNSAARTAAERIYVGTTLKTSAFPIYKSVTTDGSGNAIAYLTDDGLSTGNALFPTAPDLTTLQVSFRGNAAPHFIGTPVLSNSNKTLTIPITKPTVLTILGLDVLGTSTQAATSTTVYIKIFGN